MRIKIKFSGTKKLVPFETQSNVIGFVHKCLGKDNKWHGQPNICSLSNLHGGKLADGGIDFSDGGFIIVSSLNNEFMDTLLNGLTLGDKFYNDMVVNGMELINEKLYDGVNHFVTLTPFIIRHKIGDKKTVSLHFNDLNFEKDVETHLMNKISKIDPKLDLTGFKVTISSSRQPKLKKVLIHDIINMGILCHLDVICSKKVAEVIYNFGIGQLNGSGFGMVYCTQNHNIYRNTIKKMELIGV